MSVPEATSPGECPFCSNPVGREDPDGFYREVTSWVTGPKLQSPVLRTQTGRVAHDHCIQKQIDGQAADQPDLFGEEYAGDATVSTVLDDGVDGPPF